MTTKQMIKVGIEIPEDLYEQLIQDGINHTTDDEFVSIAYDSDERLFADLDLGNRVQDFILSDPVGKYLWNRCRMERVAAIENLESLDPSSDDFPLRARQIMAGAKFPRLMIEYMKDAFLAASNAERELRNRDEFEQ